MLRKRPTDSCSNQLFLPLMVPGWQIFQHRFKGQNAVEVRNWVLMSAGRCLDQCLVFTSIQDITSTASSPSCLLPRQKQPSDHKLSPSLRPGFPFKPRTADVSVVGGSHIWALIKSHFSRWEEKKKSYGLLCHWAVYVLFWCCRKHALDIVVFGLHSELDFNTMQWCVKWIWQWMWIVEWGRRRGRAGSHKR